jgi:hypothetical protein
MHATVRTGIATMLVLAPFVRSATADMSVYYHVGGWDAFSGPGDSGQPVCGVGNTNPADSRSFSMRFQIGSDAVTFEAKKPNWNIPGGTQLPIVVQIGLNTPWSFQAVGNGQTVDWSIDRTSMQTFDAQFRHAGSMTMTFPTGNEPPWTIGLNGSTAISNAFGRCVNDLTQRQGTAAQPQTSAPPASPPATQPFGEGQAPAPAPAQPQARP